MSLSHWIMYLSKSHNYLSRTQDQNKVGSVWNSAGTWEEYHVDFEADKFNAFLPSYDQTENKFIIESTEDCDGHISEVFIRGKKKIGYELNFTVSIKDASKQTVKLSFKEFNEYGDYEVTSLIIQVYCCWGVPKEV